MAKKEGDTIKKGEALVEVMTDKITNKVESPADGILLKIVSAKGAKLPVGGLMGVIGEAGEDISASSGRSRPAERARQRHAPSSCFRGKGKNIPGCSQTGGRKRH